MNYLYRLAIPAVGKDSLLDYKSATALDRQTMLEI